MLPYFTVPSCNKYAFIVTWTHVVKSFLHEVKSPHTAAGPGQTCSGLGPCGNSTTIDPFVTFLNFYKHLISLSQINRALLPNSEESTPTDCIWGLNLSFHSQQIYSKCNIHPKDKIQLPQHRQPDRDRRRESLGLRCRSSSSPPE